MLTEPELGEDRVGAAPATDRAGRIERVGVEFIPDEERHSNPVNVMAVFIGSNLCLPSIIFGWLPVIYGLGFWGTVVSAAVGLAVGTIAVLPVALIGPRTGTNATVSSSADFGIRGRIIGSGLTFAFALVFAAVSVWTSGDALTTAAHRLVGTPDGSLAHAVGYAFISILMIVVALLGHATIVAVQKFVIPVAGAMMLLGFLAFSGHFGLTGHAGNGYLLGSYWPTWALSAVISASGPVAYATNIGDYTRRVSHQRHSDAAVATAVAVGLFLGELFPIVFGAFTAVAFVHPSDSYGSDLVAASPLWYVLPVLVIALAGSVGQGILCLYSCSLDLEALLPRLTRVHTTLVSSSVALAVLYLGAFAFNAVASITAISLILNVMTAPWIAILVVGAVRRWHAGYDAHDLQAFAQGRKEGRYWYTAGWNIRACVAWLAGAVFGLLAVDSSPLYVGVLSHLAGGVDLSLLGSGLVAAVFYLIALRVRPTDSTRT